MRILLVFISILITIQPGFAEEPGVGIPDPKMSLSFMITDSLAFSGLGFEYFLWNFGFGATYTMLFFGIDDAGFVFQEPGAYVRYYVFGPAISGYLGLGSSVIFGMGMTGFSGFGGVETGLLNLSSGIGFNMFFGTRKEFRFAVEAGPRYVVSFKPGTSIPPGGTLFVHFMAQLGGNF